MLRLQGVELVILIKPAGPLPKLLVGYPFRICQHGQKMTTGKGFVVIISHTGISWQKKGLGDPKKRFSCISALQLKDVIDP